MPTYTAERCHENIPTDIEYKQLKEIIYGHSLQVKNKPPYIAPSLIIQPRYILIYIAPNDQLVNHFEVIFPENIKKYILFAIASALFYNIALALQQIQTNQDQAQQTIQQLNNTINYIIQKTKKQEYDATLQTQIYINQEGQTCYKITLQTQKTQ